jgi:hypothetical protein
VTETGNSTLGGCSVKGPKHEESGTPCQDAWFGRRLSGSKFVLAVGDGLGSVSHSHRGSEVATKEVVARLADELADVEKIKKGQLKEAMKLGFKSSRKAVKKEADRIEQPVSELNTTLLTVVGGPSGVAGAAVGDGGIVRNYDGVNDLLVPQEDTEYANRTIPLQSDIWDRSYRFGYQEKADAVAAFSDGIDEFVWEGEESVKDGFFDQVFEHAQSCSDPERLENDLYKFLDSDKFRKYSRDDKTIAIGTLPPSSDEKNYIEEFRGEPVETEFDWMETVFNNLP